MDKELKELIMDFHKKLEMAQDARDEVMNYLEEKYNIDTIEESETIEDELSWCYGIDVDAIAKLIDKSF